jgi:hypothetical protein
MVIITTKTTTTRTTTMDINHIITNLITKTTKIITIHMFNPLPMKSNYYLI